MTEDKINDSKLARFYNFSLSDYPLTKRKFNTEYDYYFFLDSNMSIEGNTVDGIGKPESF